MNISTPLVSVFVTSSRKEVEGVLGIEIVMSVEMTSYKIVNLLLGLLMQVLEFVGGSEFGDVHAIREYTVWGSLQQMFGLVCCDMRDCGENVG